MKEDELKQFTHQVIAGYFPGVNLGSRPCDWKLMAFAIYLRKEAIKASAGIKYFEQIWKFSADPSNMINLSAAFDLLKDAVKESVKSFLNEEEKVIVRSTIKWKWQTPVTMYFNHVVDDHPYDLVKKEKL